MKVIYVAFSIAGWVALGLLLTYWAGLVQGRKHERRQRSQDAMSPTAPPPTDTHES
jgi:hypothetical protein